VGIEIAAYAPVEGFEVTRTEGATVTGLAYPATGPLCCGVRFTSGRHFIGAARADGYSELPGARGIRDGWCQFSLQLDQADFVFGDKIVLSCLVTSRTLGSIAYDAFDFGAAPAFGNRRRSVGSIVHGDQIVGSRSKDVERYMSLIERTMGGLSDHDAIAFAFKFLLNREPDSEGYRAYMTEFDRGLSRTQFLQAITSSGEFKSRYYLPSPFDAAFPVPPVFAPLQLG
jgi:Domain of unknown function (DUF4214)